MDGCNGGGVAIRESKTVTVDQIHVKDINGEGTTWQISENVTIQNCEIEGCANMGLHPGTGSPGSSITTVTTMMWMACLFVGVSITVL